MNLTYIRPIVDSQDVTYRGSTGTFVPPHQLIEFRCFKDADAWTGEDHQSVDVFGGGGVFGAGNGPWGGVVGQALGGGDDEGVLGAMVGGGRGVLVGGRGGVI